MDHTAIKAAAQIKVFDKFTGAELVGEPVEIIDLGGYNAVIGVYGITFRVLSDQDAIARVTASVLFNNPPVLTVPSFTEVALNGSFDPMAGVRAIDAEDGDITANVAVAGSVNTALAGISVIKYTITDNHGNTVTASQVVLVNDGSFVYDNGYIISANDIRIGSSRVATITDAELIKLANVIIFDVANQVFVESPAINIIRNDLSSQPGTYTIVFQYNVDISINVVVYNDDVNIWPSLPETGNNLDLQYITTIILSAICLQLFATKRTRNK